MSELVEGCMCYYCFVLRSRLLDQRKLCWSVCLFKIPQIDSFIIRREKIWLINVEWERVNVTLCTGLVSILSFGRVLGFADTLGLWNHQSVTSFKDPSRGVYFLWLSVFDFPQTNFFAICSEQWVLSWIVKPQQLWNHIRNLLAWECVDLAIVRLELH